MTAGKTFALNRKARFEYDILETHEAGLVLEGTEIKAIREGRANIADAYARPDGGELWLVNAHIGQYSAGGSVNHDPKQPREAAAAQGRDSKTRQRGRGEAADHSGVEAVPKAPPR